MQEPQVARASVLLLGLFAGGCASVPPIVTTPLAATPLLGPYPVRDDACAALVTSAAREGWKASTCSATPIDAGRGAPLNAAVFLVKNGTAPDPRLTGTGAYFLGISAEVPWFLTGKALDEVNGAAGQTYLPVVTAEKATIVPRLGGAPHLLLQLRDATTSVCNVCEGAEHDQRTPVKTQRIVMVCGRVGSGKPECTPPLFLSADTEASMSDDLLTIAEPGKPRVVYAVSW